MKSAILRVVTLLLILVQLAAAPGTVLAQAGGDPRPDTTARATLHVNGMVGESCPVLITSALKRVAGVRHVEASYATRSASIEYEPGRISLAQIRAAIRDRAGFETEPAH